MQPALGSFGVSNDVNVDSVDGFAMGYTADLSVLASRVMQVPAALAMPDRPPHLPCLTARRTCHA